MNARLLDRDRDFDPEREPPWNHEELERDLELSTLIGAMADGNEHLAAIAGRVLVLGTDDVRAIRYRQDILKDCLRRPQAVRELYTIATDALEAERREYYGLFLRSPGAILHGSLKVMGLMLQTLRALRRVAEQYGPDFESEGLRTLAAMLRAELADEYLAQAHEHVQRLEFREGMLVSAELGLGNKGKNYVLRRHNKPQGSWMERLLSRGGPSYTFDVDPRDEAGTRALSELTDRGTNLAANALAQARDHVTAFVRALRFEVGFYVAALNLYEALTRCGVPVAFPDPRERSERRLTGRGVYDACLALRQQGPVVGNDIEADQRCLVVITGANRGGKSTFLRALGLCQLMMQCGMFVPAREFTANVCDGIFTHFKREEDREMKSGKLDEELGRMSAIVDRMGHDSLLLCNESFASTNEMEGSEIARQVVTALTEEGVKVLFVTHLYEFAHRLHQDGRVDAVFLRAERDEEGGRTFKLVEGGPSATSWGADLYERIFASPGAQEAGGPRSDGAA